MEIKSISQKIFRSAPEKTQSNHTNPFGVNFKGNMINADVFEVSSRGVGKIAETAGKISGKINKLRDAMNIGSINSYLNNRLNSVVDFGKRIKNSAVNTWNNINETMLRLGVNKEDNKLKFSFSINNYTKNHMKKKPLADVSSVYENLVNQFVKERATV